MQDVVHCLMSRLCALVERVPVGTNLGLVRVFWMLVTGQLLAPLRGLVRADPTAPRPGTPNRQVLERAVALQAAEDVLVVDAGFGVRVVLAVGATAWVARERKNFTARRATPPPDRGRG